MSRFSLFHLRLVLVTLTVPVAESTCHIKKYLRVPVRHGSAIVPRFASGLAELTTFCSPQVKVDKVTRNFCISYSASTRMKITVLSSVFLPVDLPCLTHFWHALFGNGPFDFNTFTEFEVDQPLLLLSLRDEGTFFSLTVTSSDMMFTAAPTSYNVMVMPELVVHNGQASPGTFCCSTFFCTGCLVSKVLPTIVPAHRVRFCTLS